MSDSQSWIDERLEQLQRAINDRPVAGALFELKELVPAAEWAALGSRKRSVTVPFKQRIHGYSKANEPELTNIQVRIVRQNGRERMFERIEGNNDPQREEVPFEG